jgi:hypothetical protein
MTFQPLSILVATLTVEEPQLLRLPDPILVLLREKNEAALFLIHDDLAGTLTLRTLADLIDNTLVLEIPSDRPPEFASSPLFEALSVLARDIVLLPSAFLRPDGTLEIPEEVLSLPPGTRLRVQVANPWSPPLKLGAAPLWLLVQADEPSRNG